MVALAKIQLKMPDGDARLQEAYDRGTATSQLTALVMLAQIGHDHPIIGQGLATTDTAIIFGRHPRRDGRRREEISRPPVRDPACSVYGGVARFGAGFSQPSADARCRDRGGGEAMTLADSNVGDCVGPALADASSDGAMFTKRIRESRSHGMLAELSLLFSVVRRCSFPRRVRQGGPYGILSGSHLIRLAAPLAGRFVPSKRVIDIERKAPRKRGRSEYSYVRNLECYSRFSIMLARAASALILSRPVLRERVGVRVFLPRDDKKPSP